jgi:hypothetical protein
MDKRGLVDATNNYEEISEDRDKSTGSINF